MREAKPRLSYRALPWLGHDLGTIALLLAIGLLVLEVTLFIFHVAFASAAMRLASSLAILWALILPPVGIALALIEMSRPRSLSRHAGAALALNATLLFVHVVLIMVAIT